MKSITIHNLDQSLDKLLNEKARHQGISLNKTIKSVLRTSLGLSDNQTNKKDAYRDLFGSWSKKDEREFQAKTKGFENIDMKDWL